jgi:hypothetical protein
MRIPITSKNSTCKHSSHLGHYIYIYSGRGTKKIHTGCPLLGPWYINRKQSYNLVDETKWMEVVNWHLPRIEKKP